MEPLPPTTRFFSSSNLETLGNIFLRIYTAIWGSPIKGMEHRSVKGMQHVEEAQLAHEQKIKIAALLIQQYEKEIELQQKKIQGHELEMKLEEEKNRGRQLETKLEEEKNLGRQLETQLQKQKNFGCQLDITKGEQNFQGPPLKILFDAAEFLSLEKIKIEYPTGSISSKACLPNIFEIKELDIFARLSNVQNMVDMCAPIRRQSKCGPIIPSFSSENLFATTKANDLLSWSDNLLNPTPKTTEEVTMPVTEFQMNDTNCEFPLTQETNIQPVCNE